MHFSDNAFARWLHFANKELEWHGYDSLELYQSHLKTHYNELELHGWLNSTIKYKFNSHGFRCKEFTDTNSIMFLGCSITFGTGLPETQIFPNLVANSLNLTCYNLGVGGSSADTGFRLCKIYLEKIRPKILVTTFLFPERMELLTYNLGDVHFVPNNLALLNDKEAKKLPPLMQLNNGHIQKLYVDYYSRWLEIEANSHLNHEKNILAISKLCDQLGIKHVNYDPKCFDRNDIPALKSKARDLLHPGVELHQEMANDLSNLIM